MTSEDILTGILDREGRVYTNDPDDRGGPTKFGITLETLAAWRERFTTAADVEALTEAEAREIYRDRYIRPFAGVADAALHVQLVDFGVLSGVPTAAMALQRVLGVKADGAIGPVTLRVYRQRAVREVHNLVVRERVLVLARATGHKYAFGWMRRALGFLIP